jgi:hypothetical protein
MNVIDTVASQYANSPTLRQLIDSMNQYFDPSTNFDDFYNYVWNVDTAQGFGLDVWGKIVNVGRDLTIPSTIDFFGFSESGYAPPFGYSSFLDVNAATQTYRLGDDVYRALILTKAMANISASTSASINQLLQNLFPNRGRCYVRDDGGMQMTFVFEFLLVPYELAVLNQSGIVPRPAGVSSAILQVAVPSTFGFMEAGGLPFGEGVFFNQ